MNIADRWITATRLGWASPMARRVPTWLAIVLALMSAWILVRLVWLLLAGPTLPADSNGAWGERASSSGGSAVARAFSGQEPDWSQFFGDGSSTRRSALDRLPIDRSALTLVGVVAPTQDRDAQEKRSGYVVIRGAGSGDQLFKLNDTLPDGRRIAQIEIDRVVLASAGREEVLILKDREPAQGSAASSSSSAMSGAEAEPTEPLPRGIGIGSLGGLGEQLRAGQGGLDTGGVGLTPVRGGGYRLRPSPEARWFAAVGLQVGDVLVALNGTPIGSSLESVPDLEAMVMRAMQGERVSLTIERAGQEMTLQPTVDDLRAVVNERMQSQ
ncbi:MAG TPA: type II secretion system protein N [Wenzhouxiangella sp.]